MPASSDSDSDSEPNPIETLASLNTSLADLTAILDPLVTQPWSKTMDDLDVLQKAKMNVLVAYGICDLVWITLKTKGIDPANHPVMRELQRIQTYFSKISTAEAPPVRTTRLDVPAAARFIAHAIPRAQRTVSAAASGSRSGSESRERVPEENTEPVVGMSSRFGGMLPVTEEEGMEFEIVDGPIMGTEGEAVVTPKKGKKNKGGKKEDVKGKGKGKAVESDDEVLVVGERDGSAGKKRKAMDAFAVVSWTPNQLINDILDHTPTGYDTLSPPSNLPSSTAQSSATNSPAASVEGGKKKRKKKKNGAGLSTNGGL